jgi:hypothetical protein
MATAQEVFLFSPTSVPGCQLWLDAADSSSVTLSGSSVTQWRDKSGNGLIMSQLNGSAMPTLNSNLLNTRNVIGFTTSQNMTSLSNLTLTPAQSIFVVFNSLTSTNYFFMEQGPNTNSTDGSFLYGGNLDLFGIRRTVPRYVFDSNAGRGVSPFVANTWYFCSFVNSNITATVNDVYLSIVGTQRSIGFNGGSNVLTGNATNLFYLNPSSRVPASNYYAEIIIYNSALTVPQVQQMEGYLGWKWGLQGSLPSTHPFKLYRPLAQLPFPTVGIPPMPIVTQTVSVFTPTQISGCQLWLDAADSSSVTLSGSSVTQWRDKSGFNNHVISGGTAPIYSSSSNAVVFNGNGYLINSAFSLPLANRSVFIVCNQTASSSSNAFEGILVFGASNVVDYNSSNAIVYNGRGSNVVANCSFGVFYNYSQNNFGDYRLDFGNVTIPAPFSIYTDVFANPSGSLHVNGSNVATDSIAGTIGTSTGFFLGARNDFGNGTFRSFLYGSIYETIVYNTAVTAFQRQQVEGYLAWKWGLIASLPNGHPYKSAPIAPFPSRSVPFNGSLSSWRPTQVPGCALWLDGSDTTTMSLSNNFVTSWTDKVGSRAFITGFSNVSAPTFSNGGVFFDSATSQGMRASNTSFSLTGNYTILVAHSLALRSGGPRSLLSFTTVNNTQHLVLANNTSNFFRTVIRASPSQSGGVELISAVPSTYPTNLYSIQNSNTQISLRFNAAALGFTTASFFVGSIGNIDLGFLQAATGPASFIYSRFQNGFINEMIIYSSTITSSQLQQAEGYLGWKWGFQGSLPANHPFRLWPPPPV